jgi:meromycolic acid enoyl-[acyl-carrier-protein] reductase
LLSGKRLLVSGIVDGESISAAVCFLLSDLARASTGEVLHVDGGFHAMATWLTGRGGGEHLGR